MALNASASIVIHGQPRAAIFFFMDVASWSRWRPEAEQAAWLGDTTSCVGSRFHLLRRAPMPPRGKKLNTRAFIGTIEHLEPERSMRVRLVPVTFSFLGPTVRESVVVDSDGENTKVTLELRAEGFLPMILALLRRRLESRIQKQLQASLDGLKAMTA